MPVLVDSQLGLGNRLGWTLVLEPAEKHLALVQVLVQVLVDSQLVLVRQLERERAHQLVLVHQLE